MPGVGYVRRIPQPWGAASSKPREAGCGGTAWKLCAEMKRRARHARPRIFWLCPDLGDILPPAPVAEDFQLAPGIFSHQVSPLQETRLPGGGRANPKPISKRSDRAKRRLRLETSWGAMWLSLTICPRLAPENKIGAAASQPPRV